MTEAPFKIGIAEAAVRLGVSPGTIRRWVATGALECHRTPGGQRRFTEAQLAKLIDQGSFGHGGRVS